MNPTERQEWLGRAFSGTKMPHLETTDTLIRDLPLVEDMEFCFEKMAGPDEEQTIASRTLETELLDALLASGYKNKQDTKVATTNLKSALYMHRETCTDRAYKKADPVIASELRMDDTAWAKFMNHTLEPSNVASADIDRLSRTVGAASIAKSAIRNGCASVQKLQAFADPSLYYTQCAEAWGHFQYKIRADNVSRWIASQSLDPSHPGTSKRQSSEGSHCPSSSDHRSHRSDEAQEADRERVPHRPRRSHRSRTSRQTREEEEGVQQTHRRRTYR